MQIPALKSIVLNIGVGDSDKKLINLALNELRTLCGQQPIITYARKSEAGFKIRQGWPLGVKVTLRGENMWAFLEKLLYVALPRVRDFRGLNPKSFDGRGNYNFGVREHFIFPEIVYETLERTWGFDIAGTTTAPNNDQAFALLNALGFPFKGHAKQEEK